MGLAHIIGWILVGGVAGWLASAVVKGIRLSLPATILVGIVGSFIGGWIFTQLGIYTAGGFVPSIIVAFVGAVVLLWVIRAVR